jgi:hypothetical protein
MNPLLIPYLTSRLTPDPTGFSFSPSYKTLFLQFPKICLKAPSHRSGEDGALVRFLGARCVANNGSPCKHVRAWRL